MSAQRSAGVSLLFVLTLVCTLGSAWADNAKKPRAAIERSLAIYVPHAEGEARIFIPQLGTVFAPGKAIEDAALLVGRSYFKSAFLFNDRSNGTFNLLLVTHPKWDTREKSSVLTVKYKLLDAAGATVAEGERKNDIDTVKLLATNAFYAMSLGLMRDILSDDALTGRASDLSLHAATGTPAAFDPNLLVNRDKPVKSGTGFFINAGGQVMTAAHVVHDCPVIEVKADGKAIPATLAASSLLLDLAVVDTGAPAAHIVPLRAGTSFELGEAVTNVGFPLEGVLAASPNVTRGNVSSRAALAGSLGQFQFSAPVQPGSSGGPVVSDAGELLGVTVGTLSLTGLIQKGVLPQNVNFALDARHAARFMDRNKITFVSVPARAKPDGKSATEMTLPAVVQLLCYQ